MDKLQAGFEIDGLKERVEELENTVALIVEMAGPEALEKIKTTLAEAKAAAEAEVAKQVDKEKKARNKAQAPKATDQA